MWMLLFCVSFIKCSSHNTLEELRVQTGLPEGALACPKKLEPARRSLSADGRRRAKTGKSLQRSQGHISIPMSITNEFDLADTALICVFRENGTAVCDHLRPYIQKKLKQEKRSSAKNALASLNIQRRSMEESDSLEIDETLQKYVGDILSSAVDEALQEKEDRARHYQHKAHSRLTKARASVIVGICSLLSAGITAVVTLAIHFNKNNC